MHIDNYKFSDVSFFSKLVSDYTNHRLPDSIRTPYPLAQEGLEQLINTPYPLKIDRNQLVKVITDQYKTIDISEVVKTQIDSLQDENTFCIITAHQLSLLGGPLYYVIKIANAIALAKKLNADFPEKNFVPIYWMGSEDHDFEEVNHIYLFGKKITWESDQTGPVGHFALNEIQEVVDQVVQILGDSNPDDIQGLIKRAYSHKNVEQATRELVNGLFGRYGLVIVNGDDHAFKESVSDIIKNEVLYQASYPLLLEKSEKLISSGYHAQATGREINLFHLGDTFRHRIAPHGEDYEINGRIWSKEELLNEINSSPENFSPNVILRPLFQQSVLPSIAYIGGGAEVAYWMQLTSVFEYYGVQYPVLIPRTSMLWVNHSVAQKMQKLDLQITDIFKDKEAVKKEYILKNSDFDSDLSKEREAIQDWMEKVRDKAALVDSTLGPSVGADAQKIQNTLNQIEGKILRSIKHQHDTSLKQIDSIYQSLFPNHALQERHDNFLNIYSKHGQKFLDNLIDHLQVIDQEFVVMTEME
ncbi:MAG TPA: bacillithiol biosynthesis cysteine-adding enzyme BshC [Chitinophagales bacterium]|nr:bacillithiol biosynthesis cysteine-adding enzyme BshC [Chitinophagales bacterium]